MPKDMFYLTVTRESRATEIAEYIDLERQVLLQITEIERSLTF